MGRDDSGTCPLCNAAIPPGETVCPNCGTDTSLFDLDEGLEDIEPLKDTRSLDDLLASVLGEGAPPEEAGESAPETEPAPPSQRESGASGRGNEGGLDDLDLDLDLDLLDEPPAKPTLDLDILGGDVLGPEEGPTATSPSASPPQTDTPRATTFGCPECGATVPEDARRCDSCGAIFVEDGTFSCPECETEVSADAPRCPGCGLQFVESEEAATPPPGLQPRSASPGTPAPSGELVRRIMTKYRELGKGRGFQPDRRTNLSTALQTNVTELRSLVSVARAVRVPVESIQRKVAEATRRARSRDMEGAVRLAHGARFALEESVALQLAKRLEMLDAELKARREGGEPFSLAENLLQEAIRSLEGGQVEAAYEKLQRAKEDMSSSVGGQTDARYALQSAAEMVDEVASLEVETGQFRSLLRRGTQALNQGNFESAAQIATTVQDQASRVLQEGLAREMKWAKQLVMNLKMQGGDVGRPIALLKQASASVKEKNYREAYRYLHVLRQEFGG